MAECLSSANVILPQGDIIHWRGRYSLVNSVLGGQISLVNNVRGDIIHGGHYSLSHHYMYLIVF